MAGLSSSFTLSLLLLLLLLSISISTAAHPSNRRSLLPQTNNSTTKNLTRTPHSAIAAAPAPSPLPSDHHHHRLTRHKIRNWSIGFVAGALAGTASGLLMSVVFRLLLNCVRGRYRTRNGTSIFSNIIKRAEDLSFLQKEDLLSSLEVIGRGGCGEVYKAELPSNPGKIIAIKKIKKTMDGEPTQEASRQLDKWMKQIKSEIVTVGRIRHRNLLPLLAHVTHPDCHFLVYEFMKNGSLHDALKRPVSVGPDPTPSPVLDWPARLKVAKGIAAGLEYLHHSHKPHIIHRDLKPANILLDDDLEARIADFGLAKEIPDAQTHMTTSNIAGTVGYIAPEYHQTLKFTSKCDVYSFGVILGVMVIGKFPSDDFFQDTDEMSLVRWLRNVMSAGDATVAMDEGLKGRGFEEQMMLVLRIACFCTADDPKDRPTSRDVRLMLSQIQLRLGS